MTSFERKNSLGEPLGRREANKQATRTALREAAKRLFAERGFEATTVRDIAGAANVTERTFFRYFDGKEGLVAEETLAWIARLHAAIGTRPSHEPPLTAVREAMLEVSRQMRSETGPPIWLFSNNPRPFAPLRRATPRLLVRFERSIADAILTRAEQAPNTAASADLEYHADVIARAAVAALRSAIIQARHLQNDDNTVTTETIEQLLREAFAILRGEPDCT
ncbi:MAG: TetR family transcriptional regulator [Solirubrobacteraceae bacterium]